MFSFILKEGTSKQAWLGSVQLCPCCISQRPKDEFKVVNGEEVCSKCQTETEEA